MEQYNGHIMANKREYTGQIYVYQITLLSRVWTYEPGFHLQSPSHFVRILKRRLKKRKKKNVYSVNLIRYENFSFSSLLNSTFPGIQISKIHSYH